jgi:hypothetical protein
MAFVPFIIAVLVALSMFISLVAIERDFGEECIFCTIACFVSQVGSLSMVYGRK